MAKFKAESAVSAIEYDLHPYVNASGYVPEPSQDAVSAMFKKISNLLDVDPGASQEEIARVMADTDLGEMADTVTHAVAELCSGHPTLEQIEQLPYRVKTAFCNYVIGEVSSPEGEGAGTTS